MGASQSPCAPYVPPKSDESSSRRMEELRKEIEELNIRLPSLHSQVEELRKENEELHKIIDRTQFETHSNLWRRRARFRFLHSQKEDSPSSDVSLKSDQSKDDIMNFKESSSPSAVTERPESSGLHMPILPILPPQQPPDFMMMEEMRVCQIHLTDEVLPYSLLLLMEELGKESEPHSMPMERGEALQHSLHLLMEELREEFEELMKIEEFPTCSISGSEQRAHLCSLHSLHSEVEKLREEFQELNMLMEREKSESHSKFRRSRQALLRSLCPRSFLWTLHDRCTQIPGPGATPSPDDPPAGTSS